MKDGAGYSAELEEIRNKFKMLPEMTNDKTLVRMKCRKEDGIKVNHEVYSV